MVTSASEIGRHQSHLWRESGGQQRGRHSAHERADVPVVHRAGNFCGQLQQRHARADGRETVEFQSHQRRVERGVQHGELRDEHQFQRDGWNARIDLAGDASWLVGAVEFIGLGQSEQLVRHSWFIQPDQLEHHPQLVTDERLLPVAVALSEQGKAFELSSKLVC